ncbi:ribosomal RNA small subunit methyltransferase A [Candidatus Falkowbacteria bacterium CG10_big_fil_rev_8_21_14_0_10_43_11]|uniref:Ribosomal RNA small subunit methyltransferase A n=1 Tax=Candidatus Falkowbacteria bacterium CG10_big_fil_rev_8_21_14_0_10_43_11 TaxID=1974568 RepID=A0A2M6WN58_9BACT|nr:MAG: ribosomal RNA small subunit methyltransferase A [Candidatus Falkowbacteria bacterium CG10_big_fil_rev_8_21_14_0_10_43_11]
MSQYPNIPISSLLLNVIYMNILEHTKQLCAKHNIVPARSKGQNFLIREYIYEKIIAAADLKSDDVILEVGSGLGFLTEMLARKVKQVIAVEVDDKLAGALQMRLEKEGIENVSIVNENILKISNVKFQMSNQIPNPNVQKKIPDTKYQILNTSYKVVANLPYNITSRFLRKFLSEVENKPSEMTLMLQKEVAERICARAGQMSLLAVSAQFYAAPKIIARVPADAFWPKPKVESAIVHLSRLRHPLLSKERGRGEVDEKFFKLVRIGFSAKRKQLQGNLTKGLKIKTEIIKKILADCGLAETARAQELSLDDWRNLYFALDSRNML